MPGDYTRFTFKPRKNYAAVLRQQGRVGLDSDFNEMSDVADRRWRSESMDIFGPAAVSDLLNPDAFLITPTAPGDFTIEPGRMYVDGLQAENHGLPPEIYDPTLGEVRGTGAVPYDGQPYLPDPIPLDDPSLPALAGRSDLVYLDVWRRELTFIEDPEIREIALGGPDTATRLQTVWQVKVLAGVGDAQCGGDIAAWDDLIAPSAGRLTTATVAPPPSGDPCVITPEGGYRGLENRLYRVEIHDLGTTGVGGIGGANPARFKWSRDNASVASAVIGIDPGPPGQTRLRLRSLGRDRVLRFHRNDWIELLDDNLELAGHPPGQSGFMALVDDVDEADQALILDRVVPAGIFNAVNPGARHTRVRRWDQKTGVDADGLLPVTAGAIDLEDGIQVTFTLDPATGRFHVGDYWAFAARTANGTVEELAAAPPRGILHHYVRLAIVLWGPAGGAQIQDCRIHWPPGGGGGGEAEEGCCTFVVHPGESIQAAIDALPDDGGCVCLKVGTHPIDEPIVISRSNVTLHGETPGARVVRTSGVLMLVVANTDTVTVADIRFEAQIGAAGPAGPEFELILVIRCDGVSIHGCFASVNVALEVIGIQIESSRNVEVQGCFVQNVMGGLLALPDSGRIVVRENDFGGVSLQDSLWGVFGIFFQDAGGASIVERNLLRGFQNGVTILQGNQSVVAENRVQRGTIVDFQTEPRVFGIDVAAARCVIRGNRVELASPLHGGIRMADIEVLAEGNVLQSLVEVGVPDVPLPLGILLALSPAGGPLPDDGVIRGNVFRGQQDAIRVESCRGARVLDNLIEVEGDPRIGAAINLEGTTGAVVAGNRITGAGLGIGLRQGRQNRIAANTCRIGVLGIAAADETGLQVWDNRVEDMTGGGIFCVQLLETVDLSRNHLQFCGHALPDTAVGIVVFQSQADVAVELCEVLDTGLRPGESAIGTPQAAHGISLGFVTSCRVQGNLVRYLTPEELGLNREDRALFLVGPPSFTTGDQRLVFGSALVQDNKFHGPGLSALVEMLRISITDNVDTRFDRVTFNGNHCEHLVGQGGVAASPAGATVVLWGERLIAMGNHVRAIPDNNFPSMRFNNRPSVALLGNVTTGPLVQFASTVPTPHVNFNVLI